MAKRIIAVTILIFAVSLTLLGCSEADTLTDAANIENPANSENSENPAETESAVIASYASAEELEAALNNGEDVTDAMVTFSAGITNAGPNGYIMYAGKKLAFLSASHPGVQPGQTITVKVKSYENKDGTWNIEYVK